jgi:hypothetical protein
MRTLLYPFIGRQHSARAQLNWESNLKQAPVRSVRYARRERIGPSNLRLAPADPQRPFKHRPVRCRGIRISPGGDRIRPCDLLSRGATIRGLRRLLAVATWERLCWTMMSLSILSPSSAEDSRSPRIDRLGPFFVWTNGLPHYETSWRDSFPIFADSKRHSFIRATLQRIALSPTIATNW